jgi:hypothetical protein
VYERIRLTGSNRTTVVSATVIGAAVSWAWNKVNSSTADASWLECVVNRSKS